MNIPSQPLTCFHVNERDRHDYEGRNRPYLEYVTYNSTIFLIIRTSETGIIEGYLGRTDREPRYFNALDRVHTYFIDYQNREKVYFTFDKTTLYELIDILPGSPMKLTLQRLPKHLSMDKPQIHIQAGDGNIITTGSNNTISSNIQVNKNDLNSLRQALSKLKIASEDIEEISTIVQQEKPDAQGNFGSRTRGWLGKMLNKSVEGTWELGIATAGGVLTEVLKKFFGF